MMRARIYAPGDAAAILPRVRENALTGESDGAAFDHYAATSAEKWTVLDGGTPLAAGGLHQSPHAPHYGASGFLVLWGLTAAMTPAQGAFAARHVARVIERAQWSVLEAHAPADFLDALRFLWFLRMRPIGKLKGYGPKGEDYWAYRRDRVFERMAVA